MDAHERQLITGLFDRMRAQGPLDKDADAARLIADQARHSPDAMYMLVQSVLVQDMTLQQADERIRELEARVESLESSSRAPQGGGGFLGGMFGGSRPQPRPVGRPAGMAAPRPMPQGGSPWGGNPAPQQAAGGGSSFMRSAMATAAGVAGGMLLADGIRSMMNSGSESSSTASTDQAAAADTTATDYQDPTDNDPGYDTQEASYDDGGGDFGGMDI
jgi:hypothetical protein